MRWLLSLLVHPSLIRERDYWQGRYAEERARREALERLVQERDAEIRELRGETQRWA